MTGNQVMGAEFFNFRFFLVTDIHTVRTTGVKPASGRRIDRARDISFENPAVFFL